jgi:hypothetical protein
MRYDIKKSVELAKAEIMQVRWARTLFDLIKTYPANRRTALREFSAAFKLGS